MNAHLSSQSEKSAAVIGGGFYGCMIARYLVEQRRFKQVILFEQEADLMQRASLNNQARIHNGYHYPRSFITAYRSRINLPRFMNDFSFCVARNFVKTYAIARQKSKVSAKQFVRFCEAIGARIEPARQEIHHLFDARLIEQVFEVDEFAFDAKKLAAWCEQELLKNKVQIHLKTRVFGVKQKLAGNRQSLQVLFKDHNHHESCLDVDYVFNCSYSGLNHIDDHNKMTTTALKHELTEMALIEPPTLLKNIGITVMDGAFFSMMPYPSRGLHTLSHVRYTPHSSWIDTPGHLPYNELNPVHDSRFDRMLRDVSRYIPLLGQAQYRDSLYEIKTVLVKSEGDDGRPILLEAHPNYHGLYSILGGKIDNIYDILEKLDAMLL